MKRAVCPGCVECFYCDTNLGPRHEHDHMPVPQRHGGEQYVGVCMNCHDWKDRCPLGHWPVELTGQAFKDMPPMARILTAKLYALTLDLRLARDEAAPTASP